ncbi:MAG: guanylate kinase [Eubacteriales bacterium]
MKKGKLLVLSGPSGAGKSTISQRVAQESDIFLSISATTRKPREGEDENHYYFLTKEDFLTKIEEGAFLEYAQVYGQYYGTLRAPVLEMMEKGKNVLLEIDVQGSMQVKKAYDDCEMIFVLPPSLGELKKRLAARKSETEQQYNLRMAKALGEIEAALQYDYLIINEEIESAVTQLKQIIDSLDKKMKYNRNFIQTYIEEEKQT